MACVYLECERADDPSILLKPLDMPCHVRKLRCRRGCFNNFALLENVASYWETFIIIVIQGMCKELAGLYFCLECQKRVHYGFQLCFYVFVCGGSPY